MDEPFDPIDGELPYADDELNAPWQSTDSVEDCWAEWYGEAIETHESPRSQVSYSCCSSPRKASNRSSAKSKRRNYFVLSRPSIDNSSTRDTYSNVGGEIPIVVDDFSVTEDYSNSQHPSFTERDHQQSSHRYYIPEDPSFNRFSLSTTEFLDTAVREERAATFSSKRHRRHETNSERKTEPHQSRRRHTPSSFSKMFGRGRRKHSPPPPNTHHAEHSTTDAANLHAAQEQLRRDQEALEAERNYLQQERLELKNDRQALDAERRALHEQQASAGAEIHFDIDDDVENMPGRVPFISPAGFFPPFGPGIFGIPNPNAYFWNDDFTDGIPIMPGIPRAGRTFFTFSSQGHPFPTHAQTHHQFPQRSQFPGPNQATSSSPGPSPAQPREAFDSYNARWNTLSPTDANIPYPTLSGQCDALLTPPLGLHLRHLPPTTSWTQDTLIQINTAIFFIRAFGLMPRVEADMRRQAPVVRIGGEGDGVVDKEKVRALQRQLKVEKTRWHSDRMARRGAGVDGERARNVFQGISELYDLCGEVLRE